MNDHDDDGLDCVAAHQLGEEPPPFRLATGGDFPEEMERILRDVCDQLELEPVELVRQQVIGGFTSGGGGFGCGMTLRLSDGRLVTIVYDHKADEAWTVEGDRLAERFGLPELNDA